MISPGWKGEARVGRFLMGLLDRSANEASQGGPEPNAQREQAINFTETLDGPKPEKEMGGPCVAAHHSSQSAVLGGPLVLRQNDGRMLGRVVLPTREQGQIR